MGAVDRRQQRFTSPPAQHAVAQHQPHPISRGRTRNRHTRRRAQPLEDEAAVDDCSRGRRIIENDDGSGRLVSAATPQRHQRSRGREHDRHDQRRAQNQQQQVAEL